MAFTLLGTVAVGFDWIELPNPVKADYLLIEQSYFYKSENRLFIAIYHLDPNDNNAPIISSDFINIYPDNQHGFLIDCRENVGQLPNYTHRKVAIRQYYSRRVLNEDWTATISYL